MIARNQNAAEEASGLHVPGEERAITEMQSLRQRNS